MSSHEQSLPEQNNAFDGWYHHQIQLTAETANGSGGADRHQHQHRQQRHSALQPPSPSQTTPSREPLEHQPHQLAAAAVAADPQQQQQPTTAASSTLPLPLLPEGWEEMTDPRSGRIYYIDHERQITTWDRPSVSSDDGNNIIKNVSNNHNLYYLTNDDVKGNDEGEGEMTIATALPTNPPLEESYEPQNHHTKEIEEEGKEWDTKMEQLKAYKEAHGHTNVTCADDVELGAFVDLQRHYFFMRMENEDQNKNYLTDDRIRDLEQLGFEFTSESMVRDKSRARPFTEKWDRTIDELKAYKELHGHFNVPQKEGSLGRWVNNQRLFYSKRAKGERTSLTDERVKTLDDMGFEWRVKSRLPATFQNKKPLRKKRKLSDTDPGHSIQIKPKKINNSSSAANVSTKELSDGCQVIESKEKVTHCDGSTVETVNEETIQKRTIRRADGARVLETTTKIVMTKVERIVVPSALPPEIAETDASEKVGKEAQSLPKMDELELPLLEVPATAAETEAMISLKEEDPSNSLLPSKNEAKESSITQA
eukprot:CAMPEP_0172558152 /NCGR_PEP_ID=MMETSP1067-20121228/77533_1 /TAXON_ID=265564 ORGANISM="Thalassiosira punctigera, Strain Tpunct2005C2" /NCGR_SAMPLE_ID=MMETSP1067 /ASSEMBLY_ACC=CAM_ASM_000444 /LENGTH=536 /DNA_ID=CAMNT_0013347441 /DNA_START=40 /DNA_END=1646 /DNA_ORIENTATION=-